MRKGTSNEPSLTCDIDVWTVVLDSLHSPCSQRVFSLQNAILPAMKKEALMSQQTNEIPG